jgi:hypothetical protein
MVEGMIGRCLKSWLGEVFTSAEAKKQADEVAERMNIEYDRIWLDAVRREAEHRASLYKNGPSVF